MFPFQSLSLWNLLIARTELFKTVVGIFFGRWKLVHFLDKIGKPFYYNHSKVSISPGGIRNRINLLSFTCENGSPEPQSGSCLPAQARLLILRCWKTERFVPPPALTHQTWCLEKAALDQESDL